MKKITILSIAVLALSFASCKKDRNCTCVYSGGGSSTYTLTKATKKQGMAACASYNDVTNGGTATCSLSK
jgi:hypothetical protein